jgi:antitoxin component of RelBE/YafQ-DinJ toxin-antitoxin module
MSVQIRFQMVIHKWLKDKATKKANELGISLSEYIRDLIKKDIR